MPTVAQLLSQQQQTVASVHYVAEVTAVAGARATCRIHPGTASVEALVSLDIQTPAVGANVLLLVSPAANVVLARLEL